MTLTIRRTAESDWSDLRSIRLASLAESPQSFGLTLEEASKYSDDQWKDRAGNRTPPAYFIVRAGDTLAGLIGGVLIESDFNLIAMWVAPTHRGTGIGKALISELFAHASHSGHAQVTLMVSPSNASASNLYMRMGFEFTDHFEPLESNTSITLQRMICKLSASPHAAIKFDA